MEIDSTATPCDGRSMGTMVRGSLRALFKVGVAVAAFSWLSSRGYLDADAVARVGLWGSLVGFALIGLQNAGNALRLYWILRRAGVSMPLPRCLALTWIGFAFNQLLPGGAGGDALRAYYAAQDHPHSKATTVAAAVLDKLVGLAGLTMLAAFPMLYVTLQPDGVPAGVLGLVRAVSAVMSFGFVGIVAVGATITSRAFHEAPTVRRALARFVARAPRSGSAVRDALDLFRENRLSVLALVTFSALLHLLSCVVLILVARGLGNQAGVPLHVALWSVTFLSTAIPISPGGIGVAEAAAAKLWLSCGVASGASTYLVLRILSMGHALAGLVLYVLVRPRDEAIPLTSEI